MNLISRQRRSQHTATKCSSEMSGHFSQVKLSAVLESERGLGSGNTKESAFPKWFNSVAKLDP